MHEQSNKMDQKKSFITGLITGVVILGILGGVYMLGKQSGEPSGGSAARVGNTAPTAPAGQVPPTRPEGDVTKIAAISAGDHVRGDSRAKITMIEYSDFECPFCSRFHPTVQQILAQYPDDVKVIYRHFPLRSIHPNAQKAAEAAECAGDQGKFWEMHDTLFENQGSLTIDALKGYAVDLGLNSSTFDSCLDNGDKANDVEQDYQDGLAGGVTGTPGTFVNDQYIAGALPFESVQSLIETML